MSKLTVDQQQLANFLHYGYVPENATLFSNKPFENLPSNFNSFNQISNHFTKQSLAQINQNLPIQEYVQLGRKIWNKTIDDCLNRSPNNILVPLSGGLDSRLILASLLERVAPHDITTYTFGSAGSLDFEIGNQVAKFVGTNHFSYDLSKRSLNLPQIKFFTKYSACNSDLFTSPPLDLILNDISVDSVVWSGFMGDPSIGSHLPTNFSNGKKASEYLFSKESYSKISNFASLVSGQQVTTPNYAKNQHLPEEKKAELWDIENRQKRYVISQVIIKPFTYETPFISDSWLKFAFLLPSYLRKNDLFYLEFLNTMHEELFQLPVKRNFGFPIELSTTNKIAMKWQRFYSKLNYKYKMTKAVNYINFNSVIREDPISNKMLSELLNQLSQRDYIETNYVQNLMKMHSKGQNLAASITLLSSLELILQENNID